MRGLNLVVFAGVFVATAASAQIVKPIPPVGPPQQITSGLSRSLQSARSVIHGRAVDSASTPLPGVTVRLRNLQSHRIEQVSTANQLGEFSFPAQPEIPYIVEITDQAGQIVAVGDVVVAQAGEVASASVIHPSGLPVVVGVFSETAGSVVSAATSSGITIVDAAQPPRRASPER